MSIKRISNTNKFLRDKNNKFRFIIPQAGLLFQTSVQKKTPVDTGTLKGNIESHPISDRVVQIDSGNIEYAIYVEFGVGRLSDFPGGGNPDIIGFAPRAMFRRASEEEKKEKKIAKFIRDNLKSV